MHLPLWRLSLPGRVTRQRLIAGALVLALVVGVLTTSTLFSHPAAASGQHSTAVPLLAQDGTITRLEVFETYQGFIMHKWSDDHGATWSSWASLPLPSGTTFVGTPAVVSD